MSNIHGFRDYGRNSNNSGQQAIGNTRLGGTGDANPGAGSMYQQPFLRTRNHLIIFNSLDTVLIAFSLEIKPCEEPTGGELLGHA